MTEQEIAKIATKVVNDSKFWIALLGVIGAIVGSAITIAGNIVLEWFKNRNQRELDKSRKAILKTMLEDSSFDFRSLSTSVAFRP